MAQQVVTELHLADISGADPSLQYYVYLFRDTRPGKAMAPLYLGKGRNTAAKPNHRRARQHWTQASHNAVLRRVFGAIRRCGLVPRLEILGRFKTEDEAFEAEQSLIALYGRRDLRTGTLCNLTDGGEGREGGVTSDETRRKLSDACVRSHSSPDVIAKISAASKKMHADPEFAARRARNISIALSRPDVRAARSATMREVHARPGDRERRTASQRATFAQPEVKARRSAASAEWQTKPELKANHSAGLRRRWSDTEARCEQSEKMRAMHRDPEIRARHLAGCRAAAARRRAGTSSAG